MTLFAAALTACSAAPPRSPLQDADYPGALQPPAAFAVEAQWQQRVTARWQPEGQEPQERGFDAAVMRRGSELVVLGLSPMGSVGFSIRQTPDDIAVENHMPEQLVIPPRFILLDVQRTFYPWLQPAAGADDCAAARDGERIVERYEDGRVRQRTFARLDGVPAGEITITYEWGEPDWAVPTRAVLDNGWFGYTLTIDTSSETRLDRSGDGDAGNGGTEAGR